MCAPGVLRKDPTHKSWCALAELRVSQLQNRFNSVAIFISNSSCLVSSFVSIRNDTWHYPMWVPGHVYDGEGSGGLGGLVWSRVHMQIGSWVSYPGGPVNRTTRPCVTFVPGRCRDERLAPGLTCTIIMSPSQISLLVSMRIVYHVKARLYWRFLLRFQAR